MSGPQVANRNAPAPAAPGAPTPGNTATPTASPTAGPVIPAGARFTIFCQSFNQHDHVTYATQLRNVLQANSKLKDWYVIHQPGQSSLYHGYYSEFDPKSTTDAATRRDAERAQRDHQMVESIPDPQAPTQKLFARSLFVPLDAPDPDAPPAWNLTNAPGFWTVQVAAYTGAERKRLAVESVKAAREMNVPAFYFHGANISSVCVGSWDRTAVKEQSASVAGNADFDRGAREDSFVVVNYTGEDLSDALANSARIGPDGKPIRLLQAKLEILDPTLLQTLKQYPAHAVDGDEQLLEAVDKAGNKVRRPRSSFVVQIPRPGAAGSVANQAASNEPAPTLVRPSATSNQELRARLRGIGQ
jgi:hypothetical protein